MTTEDIDRLADIDVKFEKLAHIVETGDRDAQLATGHKDDAGKLDLTLIPWDCVGFPEHRDLIVPLMFWWVGDPNYQPDFVSELMRKAYHGRNRDLIADAAAAFNYGATKYAPWNWKKGIARKRLYAAACRHYHAIERGEETDPESGLSHYEHLAACSMMIFAATEDH